MIVAFCVACLGAIAAAFVHHHRLWRRHTSLVVQQAREAVLRPLSHDMRSPLAALETVLSQGNTLPEQHRALIAAAAARLRDIANTLAPNSGNVSSTANPSMAEPLLLEVEYAVSQLRYAFRSRRGAGVDVRLDKGSFSSAFTAANRAALHDALHRCVSATLSAEEGAQELVVHCEGEQVHVRNVTHGAVSACTPVPAPTAPWFPSALTWPAGGTVVITDDDDAVHTAWHARLNALPASIRPRLLHFKTLADLQAHVQSLSTEALAERVFWVDCEFTGSSQSGLDAITSLAIGKLSVLVTSHYDDASVRERCMAMGTKLLPKTLLHSIPLQPREGNTVVLIDDDALVHSIWRMAARGRELETFSHPEPFLRNLDRYAHSTPVYIDSQLGNGLRGEDVAKTVHDRGFAQIFITTGKDPGTFPPMPWVKAILGKEPPF